MPRLSRFLVMARTADPIPTLRYAKVWSKEGMPALAIECADMKAGGPPRVLDWRYQFHVIGIYAVRYTAEMVNAESGGNWTISVLPRQTVDKDAAASLARQPTIAALGNLVPHPEPAASEMRRVHWNRTVLVNLRPESLAYFHIRILHRITARSNKNCGAAASPCRSKRWMKFSTGLTILTLRRRSAA